MKELFRSNDAVYLSFAQAILKSERIETAVWDANMANVEGSLGALPRRLMVADEDFARAQKLLADAEPTGPIPDDPAG